MPAAATAKKRKRLVPAKVTTPRPRRRRKSRAYVISGNGTLVSDKDLNSIGYDILAGRGQNPMAQLVPMQKAAGSPDLMVERELKEDSDTLTNFDKSVDPPYDFDILSTLYETNTTHAAAIDAKSKDYAHHGWKLVDHPKLKGLLEEGAVNESEVSDAREEAEKFLATCCQGVFPIDDLVNDVGIDFEKLGTGGFEVLRDSRGFARSLNHIPFHTMRATIGNASGNPGVQHYMQKRFNTERYFVPFGYNVLYPSKLDPVRSKITDFPLTANDRQIAISLRRKNLLSCTNYGETAKSIKDAATEFFCVLRPPKSSATVYGTPAAISAQRAMLGEMRSEQYNLQFFASHGVPQYAVFIKNGGQTTTASYGDADEDVDEESEVMQAIREFFEKHLQTSQRGVLVMELEGECEVEFQKLSPESIEASFLDYDKQCRDRIRMAHNLPPAVLGIHSAANLGDGRTAAQFSRYRTHTVNPGQRRFATVANQLLRQGLFIPFFEFKFLPMPIDDEIARREFKLEEYTGGSITPDEYRIETGRPKFSSEDADVSIGSSLIIRNAQVAVLNPDGTVTPTMPGQDPQGIGGDSPRVYTPETQGTSVADPGTEEG